MLSKLSVKKPLTIVAIVIIIIVLGIVSYQSTTIDMLPELELPYVVVATIYGGASPELVEKEITTPIEQSIAKVSGIQSIMSISQENASLVICELTFKSDVGNVMTEIDRAVGLVTLPESPALFDPMILQFSINEAPIMYVSIARKGYSLEESTEYLANIINKLDGVPGVAKANADGLISNLALINLDSGTTTESITDYFTALAGVELELPDTVKQEVRTDLQTLLENAQENPELITEGELDASKVLDHLIIPYIEEKLAEIEDPDNPDSTRYEMIYEKLEEELKNPNSAARKTLIRALQSLLDSAYILEDGEENEAVFNELLDDTFSEIVKSIISYYTEGLTAMVSADLLQQVVFAQDFTMPAGNIDIGAGSYVVKVGDSIASRDELYHMPVVSMDLSAQIKEYIGYVQTALTLVSVVSGDGKASFNSNDLMLLSEAIASALERTTDYAVWAVDALTTDQRDSYLNMDESAKAEWAELINADSGFQMLIADYDETLPVNWRSNVLNYIKDHNLFPPDGSLVASPTYWDEEYNTHYAELLQAEIIETEQELPQTIEEYADFIITTATVTGNILYPLDDADKQYWKDYMVGNGNFRECVDDMTTDYDWRKTIIKCVVDYTIFPQNHTNTNWTIEKVDFYRTALRTRLELMDLNRPQDAGGYAEFVVDTLRTPNIFDPFYFNGDLRDNWIEKLSESTSFAHFANGITVAKNWQRVILSYVYENRETLFPTGMTLTGVKYWDETAQATYETRITFLVQIYEPINRMTTLLEANMDAEELEALYSMFANRTAEEINEMLLMMISLLQTYGGEGAVVTDYNENTGITKYTVDFIVIYATVDSLKEVLTLQMDLKDLGSVTFFNDATAQVSSVMERADGKLVSNPSVMLRIEKEPDASTYDVIGEIRSVLNDQKQTDESFTYAITYDDSEAINFMAKAVVNNFALGGLLAVIVLFIFLRRIKATLAIALSIIISVLTTFVLMYFSGVTLNVLSMGGLVIGVGMLVDNSVVVLENIVRLRLQGKDIFRASVQGAKQVGGAILGSTITTLIVFLPVLFIEGLTTMFIKDFALTVCFSLVASLMVAITLVPAFTSSMMKKAAQKDGKLSNKFKRAYAKMLNSALNHKIVAIVVVTALFGVSVIAALSLNVTMFPDITVSNITIVCKIDPEAIDRKNAGIKVESSNYYTQEMAVKDASANMIETFANYQDISHVGIGMASGLKIGDIDVMVSKDIQADIVLVEGKKRTMDRLALRDELINAINAKSNGTYKATVGESNLYDQFMTMLDESYKIKIYGNDIDTMREEADKLAAHLSNADYVVSATTETDNLSVEYKLSIDKEKANRYGLTVAEVYLQLSEKLEKPGVIQTLRIDDNNRRKDVDVYIYGAEYNNEFWYTANDADSSRIYFNNNTETSGSYYMLNNTRENLIVKNDEEISFVAPDGKIPLTKDGNNFSYLLASTETDTDALIYETKTFSVDSLTEYYSVKRPTIDLVTLPIKSGDPLQTGAPTISIPLYKLLNSESFETDEYGEIIYRTNLTNTERIPVGIKLSEGYAAINHEDGKKVVTVNITLEENANEKAAAKSINRAVAEYNTTAANSDSVYIVTEQDETIMDEVYNTLIKVLLIAVGLIYLVMLAQFQNFKHPLIIMTTIPIAFTGSFFILWLTGTDLGILPIIGLIVLVGVVVNNGIVFVDYVNNLIRTGMPLREAIIRTGIDRLRPILMTSFTTIVALSITASDNSLGNIVIQPLALTTVGGLVYATFITLFFVPIMYELFNRKAKQTKKDIIMQAKDIDKIDQDDIGTDKLDADMDYYVKSLAIAEKSNLIKMLANAFGKSKNKRRAVAVPSAETVEYEEESVDTSDDSDIDTPDEAPVREEAPSSEDWIAKLKEKVSHKAQEEEK